MTDESIRAGTDAALTADEIDALVAALLKARADRQPAQLPAGFAQRCGAAQAREIAKRHLARLLEQSGAAVAGAKLGATNPDMMAKLGLSRPFSGPLLSTGLLPGPARVKRGDYLVCVIEAEMAVRFARPIDAAGGVPSREDLVAAIGEIFPVIEIADTRLAGFPALPPPAIVADLGFSGALVTGSPIVDWRGIDLAQATVTLSVDGEEVRRGAGSAVLGHPLDALAQYVTERAESGRDMAAGEIVSTGTWTAPYLAQPGDRIVADFGPLGRVELELT
jgi:2-keto-4-pentenoate hydratase